MENKAKFFAQLTGGMFNGTLLGIIGLLTMISYGGNYGCWTLLDKLFGSAGYESCGSFGAIFGLILGNILGMIAINKITNYLKVAISLLVASLVIPFLIVWLMEDFMGFAAFYFLTVSLITSLLLIGLKKFSHIIFKKCQKKHS